MEETLNKALNMGWRLRPAGPVNSVALVPPDLPGCTGMVATDIQIIQLYVPVQEIEDWIKKHTIISPDEKKRDDLKVKVINQFALKWPGILKECDGDREWAKEVIIENAYADYGVDKDDLHDWLQEKWDV